jgi:pimeloyl-ACP methyl ester carboxylesterase
MAVGDGEPIVFGSNIFGDVAMYRIPWQHVRGITDGLAARDWQVVRYDVRGMGSSDRVVADVSLEGRVRDLLAVTNELRLKRFVLAGTDEGAATAIAFAAQQPQMVSQLVLMNPWVRGRDRFSIPGARVATAIMPQEQQDWRFAAKAISSIATDFGDGGRARQLAEAMEQATTPERLAAHRLVSSEIDVAEYLRRLSLPALVIHEPHFPFSGFDLSREVAAAIKHCSLVVIDENSIAGNRHSRHVEIVDQFLRTGAVHSGDREEPEGLTEARRGLTTRQSEALALLASGLSNKEIAKRLGLAVPTVERHLVNVYAKIGARGRADATAYALRHGL